MPKSKTDKWVTPDYIYQPLNREFNFDFDPCPIDWEEGMPDGLQIEWGLCNFVNPPYSNVNKWIEKADTECKKGKVVVMLINAITDTIAFHHYIYNKCEVRFIKGRIKFINPLDTSKLSPSPKPSMIVIFRPKEV